MLFTEVITQQVEARRAREAVEAALRESEERLRLALDGAGMGMWAWDVKANRSVWNAREFALLGLTGADGEEVATSLLLDRIHLEDRPAFTSAADCALRTGDDFAHEFRVVLPDGTVRWLAGRGRVMRDEAGRPARMLGVNWDISDRKRAEGALAESEAHYRHAVELNPQVPFTADPSGVVDSFSDRSDCLLDDGNGGRRLGRRRRFRLGGRRLHELIHHRKPGHLTGGGRRGDEQRRQRDLQDRGARGGDPERASPLRPGCRVGGTQCNFRTDSGRELIQHFPGRLAPAPDLRSVRN